MEGCPAAPARTLLAFSTRVPRTKDASGCSGCDLGCEAAIGQATGEEYVVRKRASALVPTRFRLIRSPYLAECRAHPPRLPPIAPCARRRQLRGVAAAKKPGCVLQSVRRRCVRTPEPLATFQLLMRQCAFLCRLFQLWKVHKHLCKADPTRFHQAAFTQREIADLERHFHEPWWRGESTSIQIYLISQSGFFDWPARLSSLPILPPSLWLCTSLTLSRCAQSVVKILRSSATDPPRLGRRGNVRELLILAARYYLGRHTGLNDASVPILPTYAWLRIAEVGYDVNGKYAEAEDCHDMALALNRVLRCFNTFLRQYAILLTLEYLLLTEDDGDVWWPLLALARKRALVELDLADAPAPSKTDFRRTIYSLEDLALGQTPFSSIDPDTAEHP